jgi:phosphate transport system permease protein
MRRWFDRLFLLGAALCATLALSIIALIVIAIVWRGGGAVSWEFLTGAMQRVGAAGGVFYNILGTLILLATALAVSAPIAVGLGLVHGVYLSSERAKERLWLLLSVLNGVPSILFGLFGLTVFVKFFGWGKSWLAGGILLGAMMLPTVAVAFIERVQSLPRKYIEAAAGLGLRQSQIVWSVVLPQSASGLVTGSLLGLARAAGETAPIMFTATIFAGATLPHGIKENPVLSLPYHIFILAQDSFDPAASGKLWGAALVLLALVFTLSLLALPARLKIHEEARSA